MPVLADETQDYKVTVEQLEAARTDRTKVLLFVSPSNPTGAVYTADEIRAIGHWVEDHELWVLTDEIYEHLVYDGVETGSMPVLCPELADTLRRRQRRGQDLRDDRLAGRLADRARRTSPPPRPTCSRTRPPTSPTSPSAPRSPPSPATSRRSTR